MIHQARWVSFDRIDDILLTGNMMLADMSLPKYTRLNNMKGKIDRLDE